MSEDAEYIKFLENELLRLSKINDRLEQQNDDLKQWCEDENLWAVEMAPTHIYSPAAHLVKYADRLEASQERTRQQKIHKKRLDKLQAEYESDKIVREMIASRRVDQVSLGERKKRKKE
jgi:hypothetical protein